MHDFIMRKWQNIMFGKRIAHGKREFIMMITAEEAVQLAVRERIVHPAHVPFKVEAKASFFHRRGYARKSSALFSDQKGARAFPVHSLRKAREKADCCEIFVTPETVG